MQFKKLLFLIISFTIAFAGCDSKHEEKESTTQMNKEIEKKEDTKILLSTIEAQPLNIEIKNNTLKIDEIQGKVVLLNFWATWCPPCKAEIPHLNNLKEKYKDKFEIIGVNVGDRDGKMTPSEKMQAFVDEYKINYLITNVDANLKVVNAMGNISIIPTMFLFDKEGQIVQKYVGIVPEQMLETDIKKAIGK